ncbi:MAG TPA: hypothetical protein VH206_09540 [Xanthobacteraceae bacterium]|jgi:hypothetical protein|nr:hypothetical protein [Xanthobacteraceae bacterium]
MFLKRRHAIGLRNILSIIGFLIVSLYFILCGHAPAIAQTDPDCQMATNVNADGMQANFVRLNSCIKKLQDKLQAAPSDSVTPGTVLAFDLADCPSGWELYLPAVGRFVLGAIPPPTHARVLPLPVMQIRASIGSIGGTQFTPAYIPPLPISAEDAKNKRLLALVYLPGVFGDNQGSFLGASQGADADGIGGQRVPTYAIAPPYVSLLYCKKSPPPLPTQAK